jgi:malonyl-CoA O-methyltransferase
MKLKIKSSFDKSSKTYDQTAITQQECAKILTNLLISNFPDFKPSSILDLGAGTGFVSSELLNYFPKSKYILNDISEKMLKKAQAKFSTYPNFNFNLGDLEEQSFDIYSLIISNLVLQLVSDFKTTIKSLSSKTNIIAFNTLSEGTFQEWGTLYENANLPSPLAIYPTAKEIKKYCLSLKPLDHHFFTKDFTIKANSAFLFAKYLRDLGSNSSKVKYNPVILKNFFKRHNQVITTNYKVFFALLKMR